MVHRNPLIVNPSVNQIQEINEATDTLVGGVPLGAILMWGGGNTIPNGFTLCNATNAGTVNGIVVPNLEDKFIIGAKQYDSGWKTEVTGSGTATGGSKDSTLVTHSHTTDTTIQPAAIGSAALDLSGSVTHISEGFEVNGTVSGVFIKTDQGNASPTESQSTSPVSGFDMDVNHRHGTDNQGSAATNTNLPPYVALAYIIRTS